jgi:hypothetical protein
LLTEKRFQCMDVKTRQQETRKLLIILICVLRGRCMRALNARSSDLFLGSDSEVKVPIK